MRGENTNGGLSSLSQREKEIIGYIKKGDSSKEIADALNISVKTIEVHRYNILKKLKLKNAAGLVNFMNQHLELHASEKIMPSLFFGPAMFLRPSLYVSRRMLR